MARMSFTPAPGVNVSDADAAVGEVKDGKFFYSVEQPRKEGTMPTEAIAAGAETYAPGYHAGNVGGLSAIDPDLAVGNIKKDVNIFGKVGTFEATIVTTALWEVSTTLRANVQQAWLAIAVMSDTVPEAALRVEVTACGTDTAGTTAGDIRIVYNGVEKHTFETNPLNATGTHWEGPGIGSSATLEIQVKIDAGTHNIGACGSCYYQTFA